MTKSMSAAFAVALLASTAAFAQSGSAPSPGGPATSPMNGGIQTGPTTVPPAAGATITPGTGQPGAAQPSPGGPASSPMNGGIHTGPATQPPAANAGTGMPASGMIATADEAKMRLEANGYRNVSNVQQTDGGWRANAMRGAANVVVMVDGRGAITSQ